MIALHHPWAVLLALPAIAWLVVLRGGYAAGVAALPGQWPLAIDLPLQRVLARRMPPVRRDWQRWIMFGCWMLLVAAVSRPYLDTEGPAPIANLAGRVIVIDLGGDALLADQKLAASALLARKDIPTAIVAATSDAYTAVPLTLDRYQIERYLQVLEPELMPTGGQSLALGIAHGENMLTDAGVLAGQVVLLTGGTAPGSLADVPSPRFLRGMVPVHSDAAAWRGSADALRADLINPLDLGPVNAALDAEIAVQRDKQAGANRIELSLWFLLAAMILWLGLFRREETA
ncbi:MAG: hypothetical protein AAF479_03305 [Pseudomonadota bacterium]